MFYYLSFLDSFLGPLRLFEYVTFRAGGAAMTAFLLVFLLGPFTARKLRELNVQAADRYAGILPPEMINQDKLRTPCMGGVLLIGAILLASVLWMRLTNPVSQVLIVCTLLFSLVGFIDDYKKVFKKDRDGISARLKFTLLTLVALLAVLALIHLPGAMVRGADGIWHRQPGMGPVMGEWMVPFCKDAVLSAARNGSWIYFFTGFLAVITIVAASNAVNLTDGKDGLSSGCTICSMMTFAVFSYLMGHSVYAGYLNIPYVPGTTEVVVFASAMIGGSLGFLWHNCQPASMFMGDTGSLALGGAIGMAAVIARQELLLVLVGGVFVMEAGSVVIQVISFKLTGKRIFLCTPIHHHFEKKGWSENQIVIRFWIMAILFALLSIATLKLR